jgi:hypothetical protein
MRSELRQIHITHLRSAFPSQDSMPILRKSGGAVVLGD